VTVGKLSYQGMALPLLNVFKWTRPWSLKPLLGLSCHLLPSYPLSNPRPTPTLTYPTPCLIHVRKTMLRLLRGLQEKRGRVIQMSTARGKKVARWVSRCARNKPKQNTDQKPIVLSEDSDSEIELFDRGIPLLSWPLFC
jgi:hypothetical protein